jgi:hypothetical protein
MPSLPVNNNKMSHTPTEESSADSALQDHCTNLSTDTHAERHPDLPRQEVHVLPKRSLNETQKATRALRLINDKEKNALLTTDLEALLITQHKELEDLAKKHAVKVEYLQNLINQSSHFKWKRGVTLQNALLHHKAVEVASENAGNFTRDVLGHGMWDVARLLEKWACSKAKVC